LIDAIEKYKFDAFLGGARRDEEKARAKERFFNHWDEFNPWEPKNQRPEFWNLCNTGIYGKNWVNIFVFFLCPAGLNWMCG